MALATNFWFIFKLNKAKYGIMRVIQQLQFTAFFAFDDCMFETYVKVWFPFSVTVSPFF